MDNKFLWDSDTNVGAGLDLFLKPALPNRGRKSSLFDDDNNDDSSLFPGVVNYKDMYDAEFLRCKQLEQQVQLLEGRVRELEAELEKKKAGDTAVGFGDTDEEKVKEARRIQQYNRQKRSARASKRKVGMSRNTQEVIVETSHTGTDSDEPPDNQSMPFVSSPPPPSLLSRDPSDENSLAGDVGVSLDSDTLTRENILFGRAEGEDLFPATPSTAAAVSSTSSSTNCKRGKKSISLFDESSGEDSDDLLRRRVDLLVVNAGIGTVSTANPSTDASNGESEEPTAEELRLQEKMRLQKQIQRQKQLNRRSQRARGGAGGARRGAKVSTIAPPAAAVSNAASSPSLEAVNEDASGGCRHSVPLQEVPVVPHASKLVPSRWSDDDDEEEGGGDLGDTSTDEEEEGVGERVASVGQVPRQLSTGLPAASQVPDPSEMAEKMVLHWCRGKDLATMIFTLSGIYLANGLTSDQLAVFDLTSPASVRKAYLKVARYYHPDKQRGTLEQNVLSEKIFAALADAYQRYKVQHGL